MGDLSRACKLTLNNPLDYVTDGRVLEGRNRRCLNLWVYRPARQNLGETIAVWGREPGKEPVKGGRPPHHEPDPSSLVFPSESQGSQDQRRDPGAHT